MTSIRRDLVTVFVVRRSPAGPEFLQMRRAADPRGVRLAQGTWQPVIGRISDAESAYSAAMRELREETGLDSSAPACLGVWALPRVRPVFLSASDEVALMPGFVVEAALDWLPALNEEHDAHRWTPLSNIQDSFVWPDQVEACRDIADYILRQGSVCRSMLRIAPL